MFDIVWSLNMFGHQSMFDRFWSPNISRLTGLNCMSNVSIVLWPDQMLTVVDCLTLSINLFNFFANLFFLGISQFVSGLSCYSVVLFYKSGIPLYFVGI